MPLDAKALTKALSSAASDFPDSTVVIHQELCRRQIGAFDAAQATEDVLVCCTQEATLFREISEQRDANVSFLNIRESGGWSANAALATPKIAALIAAAALPEPEPVPGVSYRSEGRLLIIGEPAASLKWAEQMAGQLDVAVLLTPPTHAQAASASASAELPIERRYPVFSGKVQTIEGYLGAFDVVWHQANPIDLETCTRCNACIHACPEQAIDFTYQIDLDRCNSHRVCVKVCEVGAIDFARAPDAARRSERFDLILDLSPQPHLQMHQPPQGYFAPGVDSFGLANAVRELSHMVGEFEKPKYFVYKEKICAHSRSGIEGCTQCIDVCSTRAISHDGDHVKVEPHLCMGCGACASVCPSGAMTFAYPRVADIGAHIKTMLQAYGKAGGKDACMLFHNASDGRDLIARLARRGKGLPARVIPLETHHVAALGLDLMLGSIAFGASQVVVLSAGSEAPEYRDSLRRQMDFAEEILQGMGYGGQHFALIDAHDVGAFERAIWQLEPAQTARAATFNLSNEKRATLDFCFNHLAKNAPQARAEIALPAGAPYGAIAVNKDRCTLCMSCVGACPENALLDSKEFPQLRFVERNCVQCGLCANTCPEDAITLTPRLLLGREAKQERVLNEAEIFACVRCQKPFATRQMIDNMLGKLGAHSMFTSAAALHRLKMCADCRVLDMMANVDHGSILEQVDDRR
ncbi:MAG: 4Fe-4S binding protein [Burkholderiales bacterium]